MTGLTPEQREALAAALRHGCALPPLVESWLAEATREAAERAVEWMVELNEDDAAGLYVTVRYDGDPGGPDAWTEAYRAARRVKRPASLTVHALLQATIRERDEAREAVTRVEALLADLPTDPAGAETATVTARDVRRALRGEP